MRPLLFLLCVLLPLHLRAQESAPAPLADFNAQRQALDQQGLRVLVPWALANVAGGTVGALAAEGQPKYFSQMSLGFGAVNLGLAGYAHLRKKRPAPTDREGSLRAQLSIESIYLLNAGFDLAYLGSGIYLLTKANSQPTPTDTQRYCGYGEALLVQGGFLLLFDGIMWVAHRRHRLHDKYSLLSQLSVSPNGFALALPIRN